MKLLHFLLGIWTTLYIFYMGKIFFSKKRKAITILLILLLLPSYLYAVDCGDGYEWRAKVTVKNFKLFFEIKIEFYNGKFYFTIRKTSI